MIFQLNTKTKVLFSLLFFLFLWKNYDCYAESISSTELINYAKNYDGKTVVYQGEAVGDVMLRKEFAWINVNDGKNAIGIWLKKDLAKVILYTGSYNSKGDVLEISGKFNRACLLHGGDLDIHADSITKIGTGGKIAHSINTKEIFFALALFMITVLSCLLRLGISPKK
jgi:hypothetical protein